MPPYTLSILLRVSHIRDSFGARAPCEEILGQLGGLAADAVVVTVGGGGLVSGVAAVKSARPGVRIIAVSPPSSGGTGQLTPIALTAYAAGPGGQSPGGIGERDRRDLWPGPSRPREGTLTGQQASAHTVRPG